MKKTKGKVVNVSDVYSSVCVRRYHVAVIM